MQENIKIRSHGGARVGAGRKKSLRQFIPHTSRERVDYNKPLHVTLKLASGQKSLRSKRAFKEFRKAAIAAKSFGLRLLEFAVLSNHIHLLVEVDENSNLTSGMKCVGIRLAKNLKVKFKERFHLEVLHSWRQVRNVTGYILTNFARHMRRIQVWDWYSSIALCKNLERWAFAKPRYDWSAPSSVPKGFYEEMISPAKSPLARRSR